MPARHGVGHRGRLWPTGWPGVIGRGTLAALQTPGKGYANAIADGADLFLNRASTGYQLAAGTEAS